MIKIKKLKNKILMMLLAVVLPICTCGLIYSSNLFSQTNAENVMYPYPNHKTEISISNSNFNSSSSQNTLSTSLTGWNAADSSRKATSGTINVGKSFQGYMAGTYYLSSNPGSKSKDESILMINSKTSKTDNTPANRGYKSSEITLEANSYYSFEASFKSDTNYNAKDSYLPRGTISEEEYQISSENFISLVDGKYTKFGNYIEFTYSNTRYYVLKALNTDSIAVSSLTSTLPPESLPTEPDSETFVLTNVKAFYEEEEETGEYVGVVIGDEAYYIPMQFIEKGTEDDTVNIKKDAVAYTSSTVRYDTSTKKYYLIRDKDNNPVTYYEKSTEYTPYSATSFGSLYVSGLKDENGEDMTASFAQVSSKDWVTFTFFIATGDEEQKASLELWLGSKDTSVTGVAFFDDCHVFRYSENAFWNTYAQSLSFSYSQDWSTKGEDPKIETVTTNCTQLVDLQPEEELTFTDYNFDFEAGTYHSDPSSLLNWKWDENATGHARVFDVNSSEYFKKTTGYDAVGSDFSSKHSIENGKINVKDNTYALALWAQNGYAKVTSKEIDIQSNEILKVSVRYKVSSLTTGNAYLSITENADIVKNTNNLKEYTPTAETFTSSLSTSSDNKFTNSYGTAEFVVKGNALYNTSFTLSLCLGKADENATGCVVFDNVKVERATSTQYSEASNSVTLGSTPSGEVSVPNGNFNTVQNEGSHPLKPENWTITSGNGVTFGGVINTGATQYAAYKQQYEKYAKTMSDSENPYYWATFGSNPTNAFGKTEPDNILMLANITPTWQSVKSDSISLNAATTYRLSFKYKTINLNSSASFKVSVYGEDNFTLFNSEALSTTGVWSTYEIYLQTFSGATNVSLEIDFGTDKDVRGFLYLDNFILESGVTVPQDVKSVDMTNFYLNIPSNNITDNLATTSTPAYSLVPVSGDGEGFTGGIVNSDMFNNNLKSNFQIKGLAPDEKKNVFFITCLGEGSFAIQSNFNIDLKSGTYYKLSFKLKTVFETSLLDDDEKHAIGLTAGLTGFDYATGLLSPDDYETYELYFNPSEDTSAQLYIRLICDSDKLAGSMALYDLTFEETTEEEFESVQDTIDAKGFDVNTDKVFACTKTGEEPEEPEEPDTDTNSTSTNNSNNSSAWLYIPTIIFAVAIIVAVVGFFMRKIKLKKIELKRKETYDRKSSLNVDVVRQKARAQQTQELAEIQSIIDKFQAELDEMETVHKQKVVNMRQKDKEKVSKETDKEFKQFAQKRTVIAEKIDSLKRQIDEIKTPEYLLNLERKVFLDEEAKRRELAHYSKKEQKKNRANSDNPDNKE